MPKTFGQMFNVDFLNWTRGDWELVIHQWKPWNFFIIDESPDDDKMTIICSKCGPLEHVPKKKEFQTSTNRCLVDIIITNKSGHTYSTPLSVLPWWRFFFQIWHLRVLTCKILVAFFFPNLTLKGVNLQKFGGVIFFKFDT